MRPSAPFRADDLAALGRFFDGATAVVPMEDVADGLVDDRAIGLRHDCDNAIEPAVQMAEWEAERGYRATYYVLHSDSYWSNKLLLYSSLERIVECGHEIGIHSNAIAEALRTGREPTVILDEAITELRDHGFQIRSTVAHGDPLCHVEHFVNDELFVECTRPSYGAPDRLYQPVSMREVGLEFDANWLLRGDYLSDSGGNWSRPFDEVAATFPSRGQLHLLLHPCWWNEAFTMSRVAA